MNDNKPDIRILLADHQAMLREGLRRILETQPDFKVVADTDCGNELVKLASELKPDIALMGEKLSKGSTFGALQKLAKLPVRVRSILLVDSLDNKEIVETLKIGVYGVVLKSTKTPLLFKSIRSVNNGVYWISRNDVSELVRNLNSLSRLVEEKTKLQTQGLSPQQLHIIKAIVDGCSNKDIAEDLGISERTVKYHLTRVFHKVGVSNRMALARYSLNHKLIREA